MQPFSCNSDISTSQDLHYLHLITIVCSAIPFSKNSCHIETSQLICKANQLFGFYMIQVFTERHFRADYNQTEGSFSVLVY